MIDEYEKMDDVEKLRFLAKLSDMYYNMNMTQVEIANKFSTTRFKISKFLQEARYKNVVEININEPREREFDIENELKKQFGLKDAIVLNNKFLQKEEIIYSIGKLGAEYIDNIISDNSIVGILWGKTIRSIIENLRPQKKLPITAVQVMGAAAKDNPLVDSQELIRKFANAYGGKYKYLYAPLYIENDYVRKALMHEPVINDTLFLANKCDIIITGIGTVDSIFASSLWSNYFIKSRDKYLKESDIIGCTCGYLYNKDGNYVDIDLNKNLIGIDANILSHVNYIIGVAIGKFKAEAILGALKGKHINVLITDDDTASKVIALNSTI